ncbi:NAD(P)-dependent oxidoreductase [Nonomuraea sp. NPDC050556]|uniref:NAD(P)-dependent oxidoreductase n=1 Tax=Nonomuraea sp. NPDC050556 TaxID=3364369 RepID=UPI0037A34633
MRVGWIGTGLMGEPMAHRLIEHGHTLTVHNRTRSRTARLEKQGATVVDTVAEAAGNDVVVTMLPFPEDVHTELQPEPGTVVIDCSTSSPGLAVRLAEEGARRGVAVLDAPVSGGPAGAAAGTLSIMVGGAADAVERVRPLLDAMGATVVHHGPPGSGQLAKLANQTLVASTTLAACEAYAFAVHHGLDLGKARASIGPGVAGSALFDFVWSKLAAGDLEPGFAIEHLLKDLDLIRRAGPPLQGVELVRRLAGRAPGERGTQALLA